MYQCIVNKLLGIHSKSMNVKTELIIYYWISLTGICYNKCVEISAVVAVCGVVERFLLLIPRCSPSPLCVPNPPSTGHDITSSLEPPNIDTSILEEYISKEDDSTDMSVGTPNQPSNVKTTCISRIISCRYKGICFF